MRDNAGSGLGRQLGGIYYTYPANNKLLWPNLSYMISPNVILVYYCFRFEYSYVKGRAGGSKGCKDRIFVFSYACTRKNVLPITGN